MAITDAERHRLHTKLDEVLGEEDAAVLMSHLPPSGWSDVVRTRDLDQLEARLEARFDRIDERFERIEERMDDRFAQVDGRFERSEERMDDRFAQVDGRFERSEERMDDRFATSDARFEAGLERALRQQTVRFVGFTALVVTLATTVAQIVSGAVTP